MGRKRSEKRREEILHAAYRIFAEKGYHQSGIADIANDLSIGHGTFYRYFKNKRDILDHVIELVIQKIGGVVTLENPSTTDDLSGYREQSKRIGSRLFDLFYNDEHLSKLIFYEALGIDDELNMKVALAMDLFGRFTEMYLENGLEKGFLRADLDKEMTARAINAMIFEGLRRIHFTANPNETKERWIDSVLQLMFEGIQLSG